MVRRRRSVPPPTPRLALLAALVGASAPLLAGCGGDGGTPPGGADAYEYQGFWVIQSYSGDAGMGLETLERGASPRAVLGDARFLATGTTTADLDVRLATTTDDVLDGPASAVLATVEVEPDRWVVFAENDPADPADDTTSVYTVALAGGTLTLDVDTSDPRHDATSGPTQLVLERQAPWGTTTEGDWRVVSLDDGSGATDPNTCIMTAPSTWSTMTILYSIDALAIFDRSWTTDTFGTNGCPGAPMSSVTTTTPGYLEEEGAVVRLWLYDPASASGGGMATFDLSESAGDLTLDRSLCSPAAFCMDAPIQVVLTPAPPP